MQVSISYFGRPSEFLLMTSETMAIPEQPHTLAQVLAQLRKRGDNWAYELDEQHVICAVNQKLAQFSDTLDEGDEISLFSNKSIFDL
jgi:molybdopterin converting factor small subunit